LDFEKILNYYYCLYLLLFWSNDFIFIVIQLEGIKSN